MLLNVPLNLLLKVAEERLGVLGDPSMLLIYILCVCVCERERERERESDVCV